MPHQNSFTCTGTCFSSFSLVSLVNNNGKRTQIQTTASKVVILSFLKVLIEARPESRHFEFQFSTYASSQWFSMIFLHLSIHTLIVQGWKNLAILALKLVIHCLTMEKKYLLGNFCLENCQEKVLSGCPWVNIIPSHATWFQVSHSFGGKTII